MKYTVFLWLVIGCSIVKGEGSDGKAHPATTSKHCEAALDLVDRATRDEGLGQKAFNSDEYGGQAYERGVMAYGTPSGNVGWWAVQNRSQAIIGQELRNLQAAGRSDVEVLDVGSGPGYTLDAFAKTAGSCCSGLKVRARGLEYTDKMVNYSRSRYGVDVKQGDMHKLSSLYPEHSIDIIHAQSVLWASDAPRKVAHEISKVQKPGGIATFTWMVRRTEKGGYDNHASWFRAFSQEVNKAVAEGRISRKEADGVIDTNRQFIMENKIPSPRDPSELIALFEAEGYVLEQQIPQYLDERGKPFFFQYVFRKIK